MAEIRDANEIRAEQVAGFAAAIEAATAYAAEQQQSAGAWLDNGLPENPAVTKPPDPARPL